MPSNARTYIDPTEEELLFSLVIRRPPGERAEFLRTSCKDKSLRKRVEELIAAHESGESIVDHPVPQASDIGEALRRLAEEGAE